MGKLAAATICVPPLGSWLEKKKEEKRQEKTRKLYSEFSQSSFFSRTVIFHSLFHRCVKWQISPELASLVSLPPSRYIFLLSSNFVRRMYHPTDNSLVYTGAG